MDDAILFGHMMKPGNRSIPGIYLQICAICTATFSIQSIAQADPPRVDVFQMRTPGDSGDINQASDLCWGQLGARKGLWTCSDRNGLKTAGRIYFFSREPLRKAQPGGTIVADAEFTIVPPVGSWENFAKDQQPIRSEEIENVRNRILGDDQRGNEPYLDLEAITIAPSPVPPHDPHVFVVSEEPFSTVLELSLQGSGPSSQAQLVALYAYHEKPGEQGTARNDGIEGFAYAGQPGQFYFVEEGTHDVKGNSTAPLFFLDPVLGLAELTQHQMQPEPEVSNPLTAAVRQKRAVASQTLNGLCPLRDGRWLALDRNGGMILRFDPKSRKVEPWLNLYDFRGQDLRKVLAKQPHERHMPYVSIEGIAVDDAGDLWLCDDPAMPEGFRESILIRIPAGELPVAATGSRAE